MAYTIYYDSFQEGMWFQDMHPELDRARLEPFPRRPTGDLADVLAFDRPDIVLTRDGEPILVLERTVEVPSGHNVGQRFARLAAAAIKGVPCVYFGPYSAFKHGGETAGPRYMNLRLFKALRNVELTEQSPVTTIRWPTDEHFELIKTPDKDDDVRRYMTLFFDLLRNLGDVGAVGAAILDSQFEREQERERDRFVAHEVRRPEQYDGPPNSVSIGRGSMLDRALTGTEFAREEVVLYDVGMTYIRSDPYTGMALLYLYLYCGGITTRSRPLILRFPHIDHATWAAAARRGDGTKTVRLYRLAADAIIFSDAVVSKVDL